MNPLVLTEVTADSFAAERNAARARFNHFTADVARHRYEAAQRARVHNDYTRPDIEPYWLKETS